MKLKEALKSYYKKSGTASNISRQLSFAGIAIIWLFVNQDKGMISIPNELILPTIFIVISLGCDLLQYVVGSLIWGAFHRIKEKEGIDSEAEVEVSPYLNWPSLVFYWSKIIAVFIAYILILCFLSSHFNAVN